MRRWFDGDLASVREARRFVRSIADGGGVDGELAELLASELASNVVLHAGTSFEVVAEVVNETLRVEVHDLAATHSAFRDAIASPLPIIDMLALSGRGISMLSVNSARFGLIEHPAGKAVWFELDQP